MNRLADRDIRRGLEGRRSFDEGRQQARSDRHSSKSNNKDKKRRAKSPEESAVLTRRVVIIEDTTSQEDEEINQPPPSKSAKRSKKSSHKKEGKGKGHRTKVHVRKVKDLDRRVSEERRSSEERRQSFNERRRSSSDRNRPDEKRRPSDDNIRISDDKFRHSYQKFCSSDEKGRVSDDNSPPMPEGKGKGHQTKDHAKKVKDLDHRVQGERHTPEEGRRISHDRRRSSEEKTRFPDEKARPSEENIRILYDRVRLSHDKIRSSDEKDSNSDDKNLPLIQGKRRFSADEKRSLPEAGEGRFVPEANRRDFEDKRKCSYDEYPGGQLKITRRFSDEKRHQSSEREKPLAEKSRPLEEKKVRKKVPPEPSPPPKSPLEAYLHTELEAAPNFTPILHGQFARKPEDKITTGDVEYLATRAIDLLASQGYDHSKLYDVATLQGRSNLKSQLKPLFLDSRVAVDEARSKLVRRQAGKIIRILISYFTDDPDSSEAEGENNDDVTSQEEEEEEDHTHPYLKQCEEVLKKPTAAPSAHEVSSVEQGPTLPPPPPTDLPTFNPWGQVENEFRAELEQSFDKVKEFLSKDLMRMGHSGGNGTLNPFQVANAVIECLTAVRHTLPSLKLLVSKHLPDRVLPDSDAAPPAPADARGRSSSLPSTSQYLYYDLLQRMENVRHGSLPKELMEHCLRKLLSYIVRGEKMSQEKQQQTLKKLAAGNEATTPGAASGRQLPQQEKSSQPPPDIVFNHLPLGLRDAEEVQYALKNKDIMAPEGVSVSYAEDDEEAELSSKGRGGFLPPNKKYLLGYVYLEWLSGGPSKDGAIANPVDAGSLKFQTRKLVNSLISVRNQKGENANNGLVLVFRGLEEVSLWSRLLEMTSCEKQLLAPDADVVKGYGTLEDVICSNPHQGLAFKRPTIHEGWYHFQVSRDKVPTKFTSKTPGESLEHALEKFLAPSRVDYSTFIKPYCYHPKGVAAVELMDRHRAMDKLYKFEKYLSANLDLSNSNEAGAGEGFSDDVCHDFRCRSMSSPAEVAAYRYSKMLAELDVGLHSLMLKFDADPEYSLSKDYMESVRFHERELLIGKNADKIHQVVKSFFVEVV